MADSKISALTALTAPADGDQFVLVDISDTSEAATGTDKSMTFGTIVGKTAQASTAVGRPAANTVPAGTLHYSTDSLVLARSDGSAWATVVYQTVGAAQAIQAPPILGTLASTATGATNTWYALRIGVWMLTTFNGIRIVTGSTQNGNMRSALFASDTTTKLADKTSDTAQAAAGNVTTLPFDSSYDAIPGIYYALVWFSSATATFLGGRYASLASTGTNATTTPANVGSPAFSATATRPQFSLY